MPVPSKTSNTVRSLNSCLINGYITPLAHELTARTSTMQTLRNALLLDTYPETAVKNARMQKEGLARLRPFHGGK